MIKQVIAVLLVLALAVSLCAGCDKQIVTESTATFTPTAASASTTTNAQLEAEDVLAVPTSTSLETSRQLTPDGSDYLGENWWVDRWYTAPVYAVTAYEYQPAASFYKAKDGKLRFIMGIGVTRSNFVGNQFYFTFEVNEIWLEMSETEIPSVHFNVSYAEKNNPPTMPFGIPTCDIALIPSADSLIIVTNIPWYAPENIEVPFTNIYEYSAKASSDMKGWHGQRIQRNSNDLQTTPVPTSGVANSTFDENGFVFPDSSERLLQESELAGLDAATLGFARNEIFARHGNEFRKDVYRNHYSQYDWYNALPKVSDVGMEDLSEVERANVQLIQSFES